MLDYARWQTHITKSTRSWIWYYTANTRDKDRLVSQLATKIFARATLIKPTIWQIPCRQWWHEILVVWLDKKRVMHTQFMKMWGDLTEYRIIWCDMITFMVDMCRRFERNCLFLRMGALFFHIEDDFETSWHIQPDSMTSHVRRQPAYCCVLLDP
jgi:hypothetical protein